MSSHREREARALLRRAAAAASRAPSVHNTQPWHFVLQGATLDIRADRRRQLSVLDPAGRQLVISCGCALFNARVALAEERAITVERFPLADDPDLVARITLHDERPGWTPLVELGAVIQQRHTNRRDFLDQQVDPLVVAELVRAASQEGARVVVVQGAHDHEALTSLCRDADQQQAADPAYRAELAAWTATDLGRLDGVPVTVIPESPHGEPAELAPRDFDVAGQAWLPRVRRSTGTDCLLILETLQDDAADWVRAGEALERVWLDATRLGQVVSLMSQISEVPSLRGRLRELLGLGGYPHLLLRVGEATPTPATRRRPLSELLTETDVMPPLTRST